LKNPFNIWSKQPEYPKYWLEYETLFNKKTSPVLTDTKFVVLDTETTGFDYHLDRILSIGAVEIYNNEINVSNAFEIYIQQERFNEQTVAIHGILNHDLIQTYTEIEAIEQFLKYTGNSILVAHHAVFDITMINQMLYRQGLPNLKNKVIDTVDLYKATRIKSNLIKQSNYTLDEIAENYALDVCDRHTAAGDAYLTAIIFLKTTVQISRKNNFNLKKYFK